MAYNPNAAMDVAGIMTGIRDTYKQSRGNTLAGLAMNSQGDQRKSALAELAGLNPNAARTLQSDFDEKDKADFADWAVTLDNVAPELQPEVYKAGVARFGDKFRRMGIEPPQDYNQALPAIRQWAGVGNQNTGVQSTFISGGKLHYLTRDGKPVNTNIEVDDRYTLEIDPQTGMPYRFGARRGVLEGVDGGNNSGPQPNPVTPQSPPGGRGGIVFPEDVAGAAQRTGDIMQQVKTEIAQLVAQGVPVADATSQVTQKYARMRGLTMPPQGQQPAPAVQQPIRQPSGYRGMSAADKARAEADAKAAVELQYAPQVEAAKAMAKAQVEGQTAPQIEGAKAAAVETAKRNAISAADAPKFITTANQTLAVIDKAINHPGRAGATGMSAALPWQYAYGSKERDFITVSQQLEGKTFLQAFESLKGGGAITEMEGQAATKAIARLDRAQSEGEYLAALNELRQIVVDARNRAVQASRGNRAPAQPPAGRKGKYSVGQVLVINGKRYQVTGGDMNDPDLKELK